MLVEEAKKKQCRVFPYLTGPVMGTADVQHFPSNCCADNCMAWRWFDPAIKNDGYCGLAGKECAE
jgi:hypothetical protein